MAIAEVLDEGVYATVSVIGDAENIFEELREPDPAVGAAGARHRRGDHRGEIGSGYDAEAGGAAAAGELQEQRRQFC